MTRSPLPFQLSVLVVILALVTFASRPATTQEPETQKPAAPEDSTKNEAASTALTPERIESLSKQVEASTKLDEKLKTATLNSLKQALSHLEEAAEQHALATAFKKEIKQAPIDTRRIRADLESLDAVESTPELEKQENEKVADLDVRLASEKSKALTAAAELDEMDTQLKGLETREEEARTAQQKTRATLDEINTSLEAEPPTGEDADVTAAREIELETRRTLLTTELERIGQELLSLPMRTELLKARKEAQAESLKRLEFVLKKFYNLVSEERGKEAQAAQAEAEQAQRETAGKHPFLAIVARENLDLGEENIRIVAANQQATAANGEKKTELDAFIADARHTTGQLREAGVSAIGGNFLRDESKRIARALTVNSEV